jgi:hypothetical protein
MITAIWTAPGVGSQFARDSLNARLPVQLRFDHGTPARAATALVVHTPAVEAAFDSAMAYAGASKADRTIRAYRGAFDAFRVWPVPPKHISEQVGSQISAAPAADLYP